MVRPRRKRHRAVRMRVGHACDGGTSLPGWLESACAFGRSARLRVGPVRCSGRGGPAAGPRRSRSGSDARRRYGSAPYASIADDSEVDRDRPIKCCDGIHSISHCPPAPVARGPGPVRGTLTIREILTAAMFARCVGARQRGGYTRGSRCLALRGSSGRGRYARGRGSLRQGRTRQSGQTGKRRRFDESRWHSPTLSGHTRARQAMSSKSGEAAGGGLPTRRSGPWHRLMKPEENRRPGRRSGPAACRAETRVGMSTPSARRCARRAPCRASGDQSQSRWWRCLR